MQQQPEAIELLPFKAWLSTFNISESQGRKLLLHRNSNGLSSAVLKLGTKVYIDSAKFLNWLEQQREQ